MTRSNWLFRIQRKKKEPFSMRHGCSSSLRLNQTLVVFFCKKHRTIITLNHYCNGLFPGLHMNKNDAKQSNTHTQIDWFGELFFCCCCRKSSLDRWLQSKNIDKSFVLITHFWFFIWFIINVLNCGIFPNFTDNQAFISFVRLKLYLDFCFDSIRGHRFFLCSLVVFFFCWKKKRSDKAFNSTA